jgi:hypothetical protein
MARVSDVTMASRMTEKASSPTLSSPVAPPTPLVNARATIFFCQSGYGIWRRAQRIGRGTGFLELSRKLSGQHPVI